MLTIFFFFNMRTVTNINIHNLHIGNNQCVLYKISTNHSNEEKKQKLKMFLDSIGMHNRKSLTVSLQIAGKKK